MTIDSTVPVLTIDGPTASGKGSVADGVAEALGFHVLDSGALYRLTALDAETPRHRTSTTRSSSRPARWRSIRPSPRAASSWTRAT